MTASKPLPPECVYKALSVRLLSLKVCAAVLCYRARQMFARRLCVWVFTGAFRFLPALWSEHRGQINILRGACACASNTPQPHVESVELL